MIYLQTSPNQTIDRRGSTIGCGTSSDAAWHANANPERSQPKKGSSSFGSFFSSLFHRESLRDASEGLALLRRYESLGDPEFLMQSIIFLQRAVDFALEDDPNQAAYIEALALAFLRRFEISGEIEDIDSCIGFTRRKLYIYSSKGSDLAPHLAMLGDFILYRFERFGSLEDIAEAIALQRQAVDITPNNHPELVRRLNDLSRNLALCFERQGKLCDIDEAVVAARRATELLPFSHPDKAMCLTTLGNTLRARFIRLKDICDADEAIDTMSCAVQLTPENSSRRPHMLAGLGNAYASRFGYSRTPADIVAAVSVLDRAAEALPGVSEDRHRIITDLASALVMLFEQIGVVEDLDRATTMLRRMGKITHEKPAEMYSRFNMLSMALLRRFERLGDLKDLGEAIEITRTIVNNISEDHPSSGIYLGDLAVLYSKRLRHTSSVDRADFEHAFHLFTRAARLPCGSPTIRLDASFNCVELCIECPQFCSQSQLLQAYDSVFEVFPQVVWLGHDIPRRYQEATRIRDIVGAAVSAAISQSCFQKALEWFETGRAFVWSQNTQLRTPFQELWQKHPDVAGSLQDVVAALQSTNGYSMNASDLSVVGSQMSTKACLPA